jgi:D-2-hydroxyacid dehydrogenase (NADP+)
MTVRFALALVLVSFSALAQKKVVVFGVSPAQLEELRQAAPTLSVVSATQQDAAAKLADADGAVGTVPLQAIKAAPNLKWVQTQSAGVEHYAPELRGRSVTLTNCKIIQGPNIADHAMALLLMMTRELAQSKAAMAREEWDRSNLNPVELNGKTAVIIGVGGIGMQIAQRAFAFGMTVIGVDPKEISYTYFLKQVVQPDQLDTVLPQADVLFVSAPLTEKSRHMVSSRQFGLLKKGAYFVAVSRGELYDTGALVKALDEKRLSGAGLDVTDPEPLPKGHPLWKFNNVIITPHDAGQGDVVGVRRMDLYKENLRRFAKGEPLLNVVDKDKGY